MVGQSARSATDFEHERPRAEVCRRDESFHEVAIDQEILPESAIGSQPVLAQGLLDRALGLKGYGFHGRSRLDRLATCGVVNHYNGNSRSGRDRLVDSAAFGQKEYDAR